MCFTIGFAQASKPRLGFLWVIKLRSNTPASHRDQTNFQKSPSPEPFIEMVEIPSLIFHMDKFYYWVVIGVHIFLKAKLL